MRGHESSAVKVLFVYTLDDTQSIRTPLRSWSSIQLGLSYLSAVLKSHGHETSLLVLGSNNSDATNHALIDSHLAEHDPGLVGFTATFSQYPFVESVARYVKARRPEVFLAAGGCHISIRPEQALTGPFDGACVGEGEYPLLELCDRLERGAPTSGIPNFWFKRADGGQERNPPREFLQDLESLPLPDRAMWAPWVKEQLGEGPAILLGRGCPFECTYCCHHVLRTLAPGRYVRMRSPAGIAEELAAVQRDQPYARAHLEGESIGLDPRWAKELCRELEALGLGPNTGVEYSCNYRISGSERDRDDELWESFRRAGITRVQIGLE